MSSTSTDSRLLLPSPLRCPICDHSERSTLGPVRYGTNAKIADQDASGLVNQLGRVELVKCGACGFQWTDPQYSMDAVIEHYSRNTQTHWEADGRSWSRYVERLTPFLPNHGKALDVGCYVGGFLDTLGPKWDRFGIEPIPYAAGKAKLKGIQVHLGTLDDAPYAPGSFDLITLWDVAEHLQRPQEAMERLITWLRPGGILALETGNAECDLSQWMGSDWWYVALLEHCSFYTPESLRRLFERNGLQMEACLLTYHHLMTRPKTAQQYAKALLYRTLSRSREKNRPWAQRGLGAKILRKPPPCVLGTDHLFAVAKKPE